MLEEHGTILDAPRSGRPRLYTKALLGKAVEILVENKAELLTGHMLLELMVSMGLVRESVDVGTFMKKFRRFVTSIGLKLVVNNTNTIFLLTAQDIILRLKFAQHLKAELVHKPLEMVIFVDETTLEEAPHPKGKPEWRCVCFY
jgi:hypothetical protein